MQSPSTLTQDTKSTLRAATTAASVQPSDDAAQGSCSTPSSCQQAILSQLQVSSPSAAELFATLKRFKVKEKANDATSQEASDLMRSPGRTCCFDVHSEVPSWTALDRCERCECINALTQVADRNSFVGKTTANAALLTTTCDSEVQRTGVLPTLPVEVIEMIADAALDYYSLDMLNIPYEGEARVEVLQLGRMVRALLQTCSLLRRRITSKMPVRCPRIAFDASAAPKYRTNNIHAALNAFVDESVHWYLSDVSVRLKQALQVPGCNEEILSDCTSSIRSIKFMAIAAGTYHSLKQRTGASQRRANNFTNSLTVCDACEVLVEAMHEALPPPRDASLRLRSRAWYDTSEDPVPAVAVRMEVEGEVDGESTIARCWIYSAHRYGWKTEEAFHKSRS